VHSTEPAEPSLPNLKAEPSLPNLKDDSESLALMQWTALWKSVMKRSVMKRSRAESEA
jgi:hypothetical protein